MKKIRILSLILAALLLMPLLVSCKKTIKEPKGHTMGPWTVVTEPTYKKKGKLTRSCTDEGCSYSQSYKTKSTKLQYIENDDGKLYVSGKKSSKTSFIYVDSLTPDGRKVDGIAEFAFYEDAALAYAYVEDGVSEICSYAFAGCTSLVEARLPKQCELIEFCHFLGCSSLKLVNLPENMTVLPDQIFDGCENLRTITLPRGLTSIGYSSFNMCMALATVQLPEGLKTIGADAFSGCTGLTEMILPESLETIRESAFIGCSGIKELVLPKNLKTLREMAFSYCVGLEKVYIPKTVQSIYVNTGFSPFNYCSKDLLLITDAAERPEGWQECFNVYYVGESETSDPADGYLYLQVLYGGQIPEN